jgi:hypothetical protein
MMRVFANDFFEWVERISRKWNRKQTLTVLKEINKTKRLLEEKLNKERMI